MDTKDEPFTVIIVTALMRRAHALPCAEDIVFVDSTASCDSENHSITFLLTVCSAGAVPLAVIINNGQTTDDYTTGFAMVKEAVGDEAFNGKGFPKLFMTDDSAAEREALHTVFPNSKLLLCSFHVAQSVWRWLLEKKHNIPKDCRQQLYYSFKKILLASSAAEAEDAFETARNIEIAAKYSSWLEYITKYWTRRQDWCLAYRDGTTHGHQTNNFSEVCVRLYKDIVLSRCKAYNVVALVDFTCTTMEQYYIRRLRNFANRRCNGEIVSKVYQSKASYLTKDMILKIDNFTFSVPSATTEDLYQVDVETGCCTCRVGYLGKMCKHQAGVYLIFFNPDANDTDDRFLIACLALGENAKSKDFYRPLRIVALEAQDDTSTSKSLFLENQNDDQSHVGITGNILSDVENQVPCDPENSFDKLITLMRERHEKFGTSAASVDKFSTRIKNITTRSAWDSFLNSVGCSISLRRSRGAIKVQPTAIARRRPNVTRGSKRIPSGRPPLGEKRTNQKRKRNLSLNVERNVANAKSHGSGH